MALIECFGGGSSELNGTIQDIAGSAGNVSFNVSIGDIIVLMTVTSPFGATFQDIFGTPVGADIVAFKQPSTVGTTAMNMGMIKATATTVTINYTNPNNTAFSIIRAS